jgi:hypothetical protein
VFGRTEASHAINLFDMHQKYADVLPLDEIVTVCPVTLSLSKGRHGRDLSRPSTGSG